MTDKEKANAVLDKLYHMQRGKITTMSAEDVQKKCTSAELDMYYRKMCVNK